MNFEPEHTIPSALPAFAGVSFTLHAYTEGKRLEVRLALAQINERVRELTVQRVAADSLQGAERGAAYARIISEMQEVVHDQINPAYVRHLLLSVDGMTIKGQTVTPELLISSGPRDFYLEVLRAIHAEVGLTERETGELKPLSTTDSGADLRTQNTSAPAAESKATT